MFKSFCVLLALSLVSPLVTAEIFKCSRENGKTVYQNFPCNVDSIGSSATATAPKEEATPAPTAAPVGVQPKAAAAQVASAGKSADPSTEPRVGMTIAQVKASTWGEPIDVIEEEVSEGMIQTWRYDYVSKRIVMFNHMGIVTSVTQ